ncbi:MAG TPA: hypothetical protein VF580_11455 [Thermoanaerobaculia bacterium]
MTGRHKFVRIFLAPALAAAFFVAYFSPVLFGGKILAPGDGFLQNYPSFRDARGLWNPDLFSGYPAFADPQAARWYPVRVLCAAPPPSTSSRFRPTSWRAFSLFFSGRG